MKEKSLYSRTLYTIMEEDGFHCKNCKTRLIVKPKVRCADCVDREKEDEDAQA